MNSIEKANGKIRRVITTCPPMTLKLNIGRHILGVCFERQKGRPKKTFISQSKGFISYLLKVATDGRFTGHPVSRVLRRVFETRKARQFFGANLMLFTLASGLAVPSISAFSENQKTEITSLHPDVVQLTTQETVQSPLESINVSQGYSFFHRGLDLNGETGQPVRPIMEGTVEQVVYERFSYGNHVIIDHGHGFRSLYAHLSKIVAKADEKIDKNTILGTVGSTGFSTGSHLHLEVYDHGEPFNPLTILK